MNMPIVSRNLYPLALLLAPACAALAAAGPALAEPPAAASAEKDAPKPITQRDPTAADVVATPVTDLNLKKNEIPAVLVAAEADPYGLPAGRCPGLTAAIRELDAVLGDDVDIAQASRGRMSAGKVAQSVVGSFIPFRGLIREVSGANEQQRRLQSAINAGMARRSFLKGVGLQRGCAWPARSATPEMLAQIARENEAKARAAAAADKDKR
jgi:hypothetical protein